MIDSKWWRWMLRMDSMLLMLAVVAGTAAAVMSTRFLGARASALEASLRGRYEAREVIVAAKDLATGATLDASSLAVRRMPGEFLPPDAVAADQAAVLVGSRTAIQIRRGTPVVPAALSSYKPPQRLSAMLASERRALTIPVDEVNSQAGNLLPGDRVDLYFSRTEGNDAVLVPLLQQVEVLAAGAVLASDGEGSPREDSFNTITLGLTAADAARVVLAQQSGSLSVVLRSPSDTSVISAEPRSSRELLARPAQQRKASSQEIRVELLTGGGGGVAPERSWLTIGQGRSAAGDAS